jgi:hypothetical protein
MERFMKYVAVLGLTAALACGQLLTPVWVETGENGQAIARVVVDQAGFCPAIEFGGSVHRMTPRTPVPDGLKPACELAIPEGTRAATAPGQALALPHADPGHAVVLGDTGCRIKGARVQDCNDPALWPFARVAAGAAAAKPDLVIHVGDYLYREDPCPAAKQKECGGSPSGAAAPAGDNWNAWNADFFTPAANLLAAAPWAFARGNHEDCKRSWRGWFYYLDPRPWPAAGCEVYSRPYLVRLGKLELLVLDSSAVNENVAEPAQVEQFTAQLTSLHPANAWLVDHHPFWGLRTDDNGGDAKPAPISAPLQAAWERAKPRGISMVLSGHVHLFEVLSFDNGRPPQVVAGDGGTLLAGPLPQRLDGITVEGGAMVSGQSRHEFGYTVLEKSHAGWKLALKTPAGQAMLACSIEGTRAACKETR